VTSTNDPVGLGTLQSKTRIVRNGQHKVVGINGLQIGVARYDVTFSPGGFSYDSARAAVGSKSDWVTLATSDDATAAVNAIAAALNAEQITNADVYWDQMRAVENRGDFQAPYAVTSTLVPFAYGSWFPTNQQWAFHTLFSREPNEAVQSSVSWSFFAVTKPDRLP
jgi:hypothetical protein